MHTIHIQCTTVTHNTHTVQHTKYATKHTMHKQYTNNTQTTHKLHTPTQTPIHGQYTQYRGYRSKNHHHHTHTHTHTPTIVRNHPVNVRDFVTLAKKPTRKNCYFAPAFNMFMLLFCSCFAPVFCSCFAHFFASGVPIHALTVTSQMLLLT